MLLSTVLSYFLLAAPTTPSYFVIWSQASVCLYFTVHPVLLGGPGLVGPVLLPHPIPKAR